jgi:hypothetical protein
MQDYFEKWQMSACTRILEQKIGLQLKDTQGCVLYLFAWL